jgi:23S rRNA pseudouridine955/2504/2580 synthase
LLSVQKRIRFRYAGTARLYQRASRLGNSFKEDTSINSSVNDVSGETHRPQVSHVEVVPAEAGRRLDNFLGGHLGRLPRPAVYRLIRTGQVRVNGKRARPDTRLEAGDSVRLPPVRGVDEVRASPGARELERFESRVLYEDDRVLVVDKPAGLAVHGGSGLSHGLIDIARHARPQAARIDLVHRLDRETSGCLLLAKDARTLRVLNAELAAHDFRKTYLALLRGHLANARVRVDEPLDVENREHGERHAVVSPAGLPAVTEYRVQQRYTGWTLVEALPMTGRTHQIRAHAVHLGHPLAGDRRYGGADDALIAPRGLARLFLHAARLGFPLEGAIIEVAAPLPPELGRVLSSLDALQSHPDPQEAGL